MTGEVVIRRIFPLTGKMEVVFIQPGDCPGCSARVFCGFKEERVLIDYRPGAKEGEHGQVVFADENSFVPLLFIIMPLIFFLSGVSLGWKAAGSCGLSRLAPLIALGFGLFAVVISGLITRRLFRKRLLNCQFVPKY